jgi:hypothetical protein
VYFDMDHKVLVRVGPWIEFVPLLRQTTLMEREGMFVLKNEGTSTSGGSSEELDVSYGSDGGRVPRPRQA